MFRTLFLEPQELMVKKTHANTAIGHRALRELNWSGLLGFDGTLCQISLWTWCLCCLEGFVIVMFYRDTAQSCQIHVCCGLSHANSLLTLALLFCVNVKVRKCTSIVINAETPMLSFVPLIPLELLSLSLFQVSNFEHLLCMSLRYTLKTWYIDIIHRMIVEIKLLL